MARPASARQPSMGSLREPAASQEGPDPLDWVEVGCVGRQIVDVGQYRASANFRRSAALWTLRLSQTGTTGPPSCWCAAINGSR